MTREPLPRDQRVDAIRAALEAALAPQSLRVEDDSHRHAGHVGAMDGRVISMSTWSAPCSPG